METIRLRLRRRTPPQKRISESTVRFNVAAWGRQSGKTTFGIDKMTYRPLQGRPGGIYWYVLQTNDAAEVAFNRHWEQLALAPQLLLKKPNESEKRITLLNGAQVLYKSGEVLENLRAETLDGAIIDEVRQQHRTLWPMIIRPMLSRRKAWCDFYSTPNGFDHFYDLAEFAKADKTGEWAFFHAPSTEAWWWTESEIASARASMTEDEFAQEILAEFRSIGSGKAYKSEGTHNHATESPFCGDGALVSPYLPVIVGLDFNVNPMAWTLGQNRGPSFYFFDEINVKNTNTSECAPELVGRLKSLKDAGRLGGRPQVRLIGDATGKSRNTKATESDYAIITNALDAAGITWENLTPESNPPVKERVNTVNTHLKAADGRVHLFYHPELCPKLRRDLERVSWKAGAQFMLDQTTDTTLTHQSDGVGYVVAVLSPIEALGSVGVARVIRR